MRWLLAVMLLTMTSESASAIICQAHGGDGMSWRLIDNRRCWYHGRRKIDKRQLTWAATPVKHNQFWAPRDKNPVGKDARKGSAPLTRADGEGHPTTVEPPNALDLCCWPPPHNLTRCCWSVEALK